MAYPMMRRTYNNSRRVVYRYMTPSGIKSCTGDLWARMKTIVPSGNGNGSGAGNGNGDGTPTAVSGYGNGMVQRMTARAKNMIPMTQRSQAYADIPEPGTGGISFKGTAGIGGKSQ